MVMFRYLNGKYGCIIIQRGREPMAGKEFDAFKHTIERRFMRHPVVTQNAYTGWFSHGDMSLDEVRHFTVQFSVFSNQFLLAALNRVINADSLQSARESKEILMNELGVVYNGGGSLHGRSHPPRGGRVGVDPAVVSPQGTVNGGEHAPRSPPVQR